MPYIHISLAPELGQETKEALIKETGKLIALIPGKSESSLMIRLDDGVNMSFRGMPESCAYVSVKLYMTSAFQAKQLFAKSFSESFCRITGIEPKNLYLTFTEYGNWAANGNLM